MRSHHLNQTDDKAFSYVAFKVPDNNRYYFHLGWIKASQRLEKDLGLFQSGATGQPLSRLKHTQTSSTERSQKFLSFSHFKLRRKRKQIIHILFLVIICNFSKLKYVFNYYCHRLWVISRIFSYYSKLLLVVNIIV